jgi:hypothetical protein
MAGLGFGIRDFFISNERSTPCQQPGISSGSELPNGFDETGWKVNGQGWTDAEKSKRRELRPFPA